MARPRCGPYRVRQKGRLKAIAHGFRADKAATPMRGPGTAQTLPPEPIRSDLRPYFLSAGHGNLLVHLQS